MENVPSTPLLPATSSLFLAISIQTEDWSSRCWEDKEQFLRSLGWKPCVGVVAGVGQAGEGGDQEFAVTVTRAVVSLAQDGVCFRGQCGWGFGEAEKEIILSFVPR